MFSSSQDILYLVLAFCILWVSGFLCWLLYYAVKILKDTSKIVEEFRIRLQNLSELVQTISDKIESVYDIVNSWSGVSGVIKKFMHRKTDEWVDEGSERVHDMARDVVDRAVSSTAEKMRRTSRRMKSSSQKDEE